MSDLPAPPALYSDEEMVEYLAEFMPEIREYYRILTLPAATLPEFLLPAPSPISKSGGPHKRKRWSQEEHEQFLMGIEVYGRGKWRKISQNFVKTRTSNQVANHAQQFFRRCEANKHNTAAASTKKRASIHDITITTDQVLFSSITR